MDIPRPRRRHSRRVIAAGALVGVAAWALMAFTLIRRDPVVERAGLEIDTVRRAPFVRQIKAPGTMVPEHLQYVVALVSGRVDALPFMPGTHVSRSSVIVELSNPDVQLEALNATRQLTDAQAGMLALQSSLRSQRVTQSGLIAQLTAQHAAAARDSVVYVALGAKHLASANEVSRAIESAAEVGLRLRLEQERMNESLSSDSAQLRVAAQSVERMKVIEQFQRNRIAGMRVTAGEEGNLLSIGTASQTLERGQWVVAGQTLATIAQTGTLKAVLRVPETLAKDVTVGQRAMIDTRNGVVAGHVTRSDPSSVNGTVQVEVSLDGPAPRGARADLGVDATIEVERLPSVVQIKRPSWGESGSTQQAFRVDGDGRHATRVTVRFGRTSLDDVEIRDGLAPGDRVIRSDMSPWLGTTRVRLH